MTKLSRPIGNDFLPQTLFLYGTYDENERPDFGLFCWFSYYWDQEMHVMAAIGGDKLTRENIHQHRIFSANLVTEDILALSDYFGSTDGHDPEKMNIDVAIEKGQVLNVPVLVASPVAFELEVEKFLPMDDGELLLCKIRNVLQDETLSDETLPVAEKLANIRPVTTTCQTYFGWDGRKLCDWHELAPSIRRK